MNIPGSSLANFSPTNHSNLFNVSEAFGSAPKINNSFSDSLFLQHSSHLISPMNDGLSISPDIRYFIKKMSVELITFRTRL